MHVVRLGLQGVELLETGRISLPVPEPDRSWLVALRQGRHTRQEALDRTADLEERLHGPLRTSPLPEWPDAAAADRWLVEAYRLAWA